MIQELFNSYEFTFAGESCLSYGLMIYDFNGVGQSNVGFGNTASIMEARTNRRVAPIHYGVNYNSKPLEFKLVFGAQRPLARYEMERISLWLTGYSNYQWMYIDQPDLSHVQFRCLITSLTPLAHGWLPVAFEATVRCDCPYAYSLPFEITKMVSGTSTAVIFNDGSVRDYVKPKLTYDKSNGVTSLRIVNHSDGGREFLLNGLPSAATAGTGQNLYSGFNMNFFRLVPGENVLEITGNGMLTFEGRFLHNVAG